MKPSSPWIGSTMSAAVSSWATWDMKNSFRSHNLIRTTISSSSIFMARIFLVYPGIPITPRWSPPSNNYIVISINYVGTYKSANTNTILHTDSRLSRIWDIFIGRKKELSLLDEAYTSRKGELVVIYGRRSKEETIKYLMVFGGVPKYLEQVNTNKSFNQNMNQLCFSPLTDNMLWSKTRA